VHENSFTAAYPDLITMAEADDKAVIKNTASYISARFHPDGLILAGGTYLEGIKLWDIREPDQLNVSALTDHNAPINSLSFSENGYYLASAGGDGSVKVWDLRKLKCIKTIDCSFAYIARYLILTTFISRRFDNRNCCVI